MPPTMYSQSRGMFGNKTGSPVVCGQIVHNESKVAATLLFD
jgi:hypothetical protein